MVPALVRGWLDNASNHAAKLAAATPLALMMTHIKAKAKPLERFLVYFCG